MKEQTPLEKIIEFINDTQVHLLDSTKIKVLREIRDKAESLLPEERKEIDKSKQIAEIEVVMGKIELLEGLRIFYKGVDISDNNVIKKLRELEQLRDKLINELNK